MPPLDKFERYNECFGIYQDDAKYCFVKSLIKPDASSKLYKFIAEFSSDRRQHFRHDKLNRGICINSCEEALKKLGDEANKYFVAEFKTNNEPLPLNSGIVKFTNASEDREKYNRQVNQCVNLELMEVYRLQAFSSIEYCSNYKNTAEKGNERRPKAKTLLPNDAKDLMHQFQTGSTSSSCL